MEEIVRFRKAGLPYKMLIFLAILLANIFKVCNGQCVSSLITNPPLVVQPGIRIPTEQNVTFTCNLTSYLSQPIEIILNYNRGGSTFIDTIDGCSKNGNSEYVSRISSTSNCNYTTKFIEWKLTNVTVQDTGCWICQFQRDGNFGSIQASIIRFATPLTVFVHVAPTTPILTSSPVSIINDTVTIMKGEYLQITCTTTIDAEPVTYEWHSKKHGILPEGKNVLNITIDQDDNYWCKAINFKGTATSKTLEIFAASFPTEIQLSADYEFPIGEGTSVTFTCSGTGTFSPMPVFTLYQISPKNVKTSLQSERRSPVIYFEEINYQVNGFSIICIATIPNLAGTVRSSNVINISVIVLPTKPTLSSLNQEIKTNQLELFKSENVSLLCSSDPILSNQGNVSFKWYTGTQRKQVGNGQFYQIINIQPYQAGVYSCSANNLAGEIFSENITIVELYLPRKIELSSNPVFPVLENVNVTVKCIASSSFPLPNLVISLVNNSTLQSSTVKSLVGKSSADFIFNATKSLNGNYFVCSATHQKWTPRNVQSERLESIIYYLPTVSLKTTSSPIPLGTELTLNCSTISGIPPTVDSYTWYHNGSNGVENLSQNINTIIKKEPTYFESGSYKCGVTTAAGTTWSDWKEIVVLSKPILAVPIQIQYLNIESNMTYSLTFDIRSNPKPLNGNCTNLDNKVELKEIEAYSWKFEVTPFKMEHLGKWNCSATNTLGTGYFSFNLEENDKPTAESLDVATLVVGVVFAVFILIIVIITIIYLKYTYAIEEIEDSKGNIITRSVSDVQRLKLTDKDDTATKPTVPLVVLLSYKIRSSLKGHKRRHKHQCRGVRSSQPSKPPSALIMRDEVDLTPQWEKKVDKNPLDFGRVPPPKPPRHIEIDPRDLQLIVEADVINAMGKEADDATDKQDKIKAGEDGNETQCASSGEFKAEEGLTPLVEEDESEQHVYDNEATCIT